MVLYFVLNSSLWFPYSFHLYCLFPIFSYHSLILFFDSSLWVLKLLEALPKMAADISHPPMEQLQDLEYCIDSNPPWRTFSVFPCLSPLIRGKTHSEKSMLLFILGKPIKKFEKCGYVWLRWEFAWILVPLSTKFIFLCKRLHVSLSPSVSSGLRSSSWFFLFGGFRVSGHFWNIEMVFGCMLFEVQSIKHFEWLGWLGSTALQIWYMTKGFFNHYSSYFVLCTSFHFPFFICSKFSTFFFLVSSVKVV